MEIGTIVLSQSEGERIIGIVINVLDANNVSVAWVSDQRGAFWCNEAVHDLTPARLGERAEIGDPIIDHVELAMVIYDLT